MYYQFLIVSEIKDYCKLGTLIFACFRDCVCKFYENHYVNFFQGDLSKYLKIRLVFEPCPTSIFFLFVEYVAYFDLYAESQCVQGHLSVMNNQRSKLTKNLLTDQQRK